MKKISTKELGFEIVDYLINNDVKYDNICSRCNTWSVDSIFDWIDYYECANKYSCDNCNGECVDWDNEYECGDTVLIEDY